MSVITTDIMIVVLSGFADKKQQVGQDLASRVNFRLPSQKITNFGRLKPTLQPKI